MRVPTYVIGVCFGCYLQHIDCKIKLDKVVYEFHQSQENLIF